MVQVRYILHALLVCFIFVAHVNGRVLKEEVISARRPRTTAPQLSQDAGAEVPTSEGGADGGGADGLPSRPKRTKAPQTSDGDTASSNDNQALDASSSTTTTTRPRRTKKPGTSQDGSDDGPSNSVAPNAIVGTGPGAGASSKTPVASPTTPSVSPVASPTTPSVSPVASYAKFTHLVQTWVPGFCKAFAAENPPQCLSSEPDQKLFWNQNFIIHGLWPIGSKYRSSQALTPIIFAQAVSANALKYSYANLMEPLESSNAWNFANHEWKTHGVESGLSPAQYLDDVQDVHQRISTPSFIGANAGMIVPLTSLQASFPSDPVKGTTSAACMVCREDPTTGQKFLIEVRYCLNVNPTDHKAGTFAQYKKCRAGCKSCLSTSGTVELPILMTS